jgi:hypothetical protein
MLATNNAAAAIVLGVLLGLTLVIITVLVVLLVKCWRKLKKLEQRLSRG